MDKEVSFDDWLGRENFLPGKFEPAADSSAYVQAKLRLIINELKGINLRWPTMFNARDAKLNDEYPVASLTLQIFLAFAAPFRLLVDDAEEGSALD
jgi:hypothetical protein